MKPLKMISAALAFATLVAYSIKPAGASIDSMNLGASYNAQKTSITAYSFTCDNLS